MRKVVNGVLAEMTAEEIAQMEKHTAKLPAAKPTLEERLDVLEQALRKWLKL